MASYYIFIYAINLTEVPAFGRHHAYRVMSEREIRHGSCLMGMYGLSERDDARNLPRV